MKLEEVLVAIRPTKAEMLEETRFAKEVVSKIGQHAASYGGEAVLTGSIAKKTFLRNSKDIDVFVLFERNFPKEKFEKTVKEILEKTYPGTRYQISYAEHPYIRFHLHGKKIDLVPAYRITNAKERLSAVDRSVLHTKFVKAALDQDKIDDVLLLKAFLKANELYGAEIKIEGFSGYLCELLIIKYGGFVKLLRAAAKWKIKKLGGQEIVELVDFFGKKTKKELLEIHKKFGSFVVIDPTDSNRNVAAALSIDNLKKFIGLAKHFLKRKAMGMFKARKSTMAEKLARIKKIKYLVSMPRPAVVDDVLWGQLKKVMNQLERELAEFGATTFAEDSRHLVKIAIVLQKERLDESEILVGPPLEMKKNVSEFKKSHKNGKFITKIIEKKKRICVKAKRKNRDAEWFIHNFFRSLKSTHLAYPPEMVVVTRG